MWGLEFTLVGLGFGGLRIYDGFRVADDMEYSILELRL